MADNFDTNVARRKPNILKKPRPIHPWDVRDVPRDNDSNDTEESHTETVSTAAVSVSADNAVSQRPEIQKKPKIKAVSSRNRKPVVKKSAEVATSDKSSDLSNTINIHSNFCKLDNDVSDHLFPRLSPSSQSVYLRLYRQSFGWNRNWAAESLPKLSKSCNLSLQTIRKAIKELESVGCIKKEFSDYHKATVYRVFLPSEIGIGKSASANNAGLVSDTPQDSGLALDSQNAGGSDGGAQIPDGGSIDADGVKKFDRINHISGGLESDTQSIYFAGTSIYVLLESEGALPKNIRKYIEHKHISNAVSVIDEFYDSIGFSIVSRAVYRKSLIDYFELLKSGFTVDDIRYAVRWTFRNSRTRPESFSLIKHTMHLAMDDLIRDLKKVSGEKESVRKKSEAVRKSAEWETADTMHGISNDDLKLWASVVDDLRNELNERSFKAFIEPIRLVSVDGNSVSLSAPPDFVSWIVDHYLDVIQEMYVKKAGAAVIVDIQ